MAINSPSSINIYNQCPRLYYYLYVEKRRHLLTKTDITLIKGNIIHKALETFFTEDPPPTEPDKAGWASQRIRRLFMKEWDRRKAEIRSIRISNSELEEHYHDCLDMLDHWIKDFLKRIAKTNLPFDDAFQALKPNTEVECYVKEYDVRGVIDAIENEEGEVTIIDYKTSAKFDMTREYKLQLAIYAYAYERTHGVRPSKVGMYFLKEGLRYIAVDDPMIELAERECKRIHEKTRSIDIKDYPQNEGYLCRSMGLRCPCRRYETNDDEE